MAEETIGSLQMGTNHLLQSSKLQYHNSCYNCNIPHPFFLSYVEKQRQNAKCSILMKEYRKEIHQDNGWLITTHKIQRFSDSFMWQWYLEHEILLPTHTAWNFPKSLSIFSKIVGIEYFSSPNSDIFVHNRFKDVYFFLKTFNLPNHFFISKSFHNNQ